MGGARPPCPLWPFPCEPRYLPSPLLRCKLPEDKSPLFLPLASQCPPPPPQQVSGSCERGWGWEKRGQDLKKRLKRTGKRVFGEDLE